MRGLNHNEDWSWSNVPRGKGSGGGTNTVEQQSGPPPQVLANYQNVFGQAQGVAQQPYQTYSGSLIAPFSPQQQAGFNDVNQAVNAGYPFLNQASQDATNATGLLAPGSFQGTNQAYQDPGLAAYLGTAQGQIGSALGQSSAASGSLNAQNFGNTVNSYYSPYAQSVIAPTQALFNQQNATQLNQVRGNASAQGAFGGDREAVAEAQTAQQQQLAEAPTLAGLETQGYQNATQNALAAAGLGQQTAGLTLQGAGATAGLGNLQQQGYNAATGAAQGNAWLNSQGAFSLGSLGQEAQSMGLSGANALLSSGAQQQALEQQEMNLPYSQFQTAQQNPYQMTNWLEGLATGTGSLSGQQGSTTSPSPSSLSQIAGLGLTGTGILGATGAFGSSGWLSGLGSAGAFDSAGTAVGDALAAAAAGETADAGLGAAGAALAFAKRGGRIDRDGHRAIQGLRGFHIPRRDSGGGVNPAMSAMFGGNPLQTNLYSMYANLPTEKLQELAARTPGNQMVTRALQLRQMAPQSDPAMQPQQQPGLGAVQPQGQQMQGQQMQAAPGGFSSGGYVHRDAGGGLMDDSALVNNDFGETPPLLGGMAPSALSGTPTPVLGAGAGPMPDPGAGVGSMSSIGQATPIAGLSGVKGPPPAPPRIRSTSEPMSGMGAGTVQPQQSIKTDDTNINEVQPQTAGLGAANKDFMAGPWGTLLAAGLGIMGGTSPFAAVNIGKGGLQGLQFAQGEQRMESQEALRQQQLQNSADYRKELVAGRSDSRDIEAQRIAQTGDIEKQRLAQSGSLEQQKMALQQQAIDQGKFTWQPGMGTDPNDATKQISGTWRLPTTGQGQPQFFAGQTLTQKAPSGAAPTMPQDVINTIAQQALAGDTSALSGLGYGNAGAQARIAVRTAMTQQMHAQNPNSTGADIAANVANFMGEKAGSRAAGTREANVGMAVNEAENFMPLALQASANVNRTQFPTLNGILQAYEKGTGDKNIVRLAVATNSLTNAYSRAITPSGIPTEGNQQRARELLDKAWTKGQFSTAVDQLHQEMVAAKESPIQQQQEQRARISGQPQPSSQGGIAPPQGAIDYLKKNPGLAPQFKAKYGVDPSQYLGSNG